MRRRSWAAALALLPLVAAPARPATAPAGTAPPAARPSAGVDYEELAAEYDEANAGYMRKLRELSSARDTEGVEALRKENPAYAFLPRFQAGAQENAGKDAAVPFLSWIVQNGAPGGAQDLEPALAALATLQAAHIGSEAIADLVSRMRFTVRSLGEEPCLAFLDVVVEKSPHAAIQADALFARGSIRLSGDPSDEQRAQGLADMRRVLELAPDSENAKRAEATIFQAERLQIGMVAPDIEGEDLLGVPFKLSDYRGKVVVIDFWGDW